VGFEADKKRENKKFNLPKRGDTQREKNQEKKSLKGRVAPSNGGSPLRKHWREAAKKGGARKKKKWETTRCHDKGQLGDTGCEWDFEKMRRTNPSFLVPKKFPTPRKEKVLNRQNLLGIVDVSGGFFLI